MASPTLSHRIEYAASSILGGLSRAMGPRAADRCGVLFGRLVHWLMTSRRELARSNLRHAFGDELSEPEVVAITRRVFESIGRSFFQFARFPVMTPDDVRRMVVSSGEEHMRRAHEQGNGFVFLTSHFGNWELLGSWIRAQGYTVSFIVGTQSNPLIHDMINRFRKALGVDVINTNELRRVFKALRNNEVVATAGDQHAPAEAILLDFLGRPAWVARGPALFAHRCNCPIVPCLLVRERYDRHVVLMGEPIYSPRSGDDEADILVMTEAHTRFFEQGIRKYPDQWMWTHNRWKHVAGAGEKGGNQAAGGS